MKTLKILIVFGILTGLIIFSIPYIIGHYVLPTDGVREATFSVRKESAVGFFTRDGIKLVADIYHPQGIQKTPTILVRIPFTKTLFNQFLADIIAEYWASRGYTVVIQGTRGRYKSGGIFYPLIHEREDGIDTLKWIENQSFYDGRLGMWGGSAFGQTQWVVSDQHAPGPTALFIHIASSQFHKLFYQGGAFALESALFWTMRSRGQQDHEVDIKILAKALDHLPIIDADISAIGKTDFYRDWVRNEKDTVYWKRIDGSPDRSQSLQAPLLLMGGWFDPFLPAQLDDFIAIQNDSKEDVSSKTRLIIGPWKHAASVKLPPGNLEIPYRSHSLAPSIPWFDYHLGFSKAPLNMPQVKLFVMGINQWRSENEWPLARTHYVPFYLQSQRSAKTLKGDGVLTKELLETSAFDDYSYDPLDPVPSAGGSMLGDRAGIQKQNLIEERTDVLVYTTPPLEIDTEITGPVRVVLYVSTDAPSTDFTAKLVDVHPNGRAYNLYDGILRQIYGKSEKSNKEIPVKIEINLGATSNVFFKGHKIRLEISSSNFPKYNRNLNTGAYLPTATQTKIANQRVFHTQHYPSRVILPIIL